jgi:hypothetical protein
MSCWLRVVCSVVLLMELLLCRVVLCCGAAVLCCVRARMGVCCGAAVLCCVRACVEKYFNSLNIFLCVGVLC